VCTSGNPRNYRDRTSGLITLDNGSTILVDAGPDLRQQALKHKISSIENVIFTHAHADHILGTDDLRTFNFITKKRITCFGSEPTLTGIKQLFPYIFNPNPHYEGGMVAQLDLVEIRNDQNFTVAGTTIIPFPLTHGALTVTGLRIGQLGYATDFKTMSERGKEVLRGVKYLFIDGLRFEPHRTHLTISEAIDLARELGAEQTYLIHTTHSVDYDEVNSQLPKGIELGYDGLKVSFS
jgi:phosphoribosyl 1,2-cyclic phosphate phosphodiesterase